MTNVQQRLGETLYQAWVEAVSDYFGSTEDVDSLLRQTIQDYVEQEATLDIDFDSLFEDAVKTHINEFVDIGDYIDYGYLSEELLGSNKFEVPAADERLIEGLVDTAVEESCRPTLSEHEEQLLEAARRIIELDEEVRQLTLFVADMEKTKRQSLLQRLRKFLGV